MSRLEKKYYVRRLFPSCGFEYLCGLSLDLCYNPVHACWVNDISYAVPFTQVEAAAIISLLSAFGFSVLSVDVCPASLGE